MNEGKSEGASDVKNLYEKYPFPNDSLGLENGDYVDSFDSLKDKWGWVLNGLPKTILPFNEILDAGCGTGEISCFLSKKANVTGIDFSESSIKLANKLKERFQIKDVNFDVGDLTKIKLNKKFDYIFSMGVLHHIPEMNKAIQNLKSHLKDNGIFVINVYNKYGKIHNRLFKQKLNKTYDMDSYNHPYERFFTQKEFRGILNKNGLKVIGMDHWIPEWLRLITGKYIMTFFCVKEIKWKKMLEKE